MMHLLQNGGRCGVIVPDDVLFGSSKAHKKLRPHMLGGVPAGGHSLHALGSLPALRWCAHGGLDQHPERQDGEGLVLQHGIGCYSLDDKRNFIDGKGNMPDIIERYREWRDENPTDGKGKCFFVPYNEIKENGYDLSLSNTERSRTKRLPTRRPEVILDKIEALEDQIKANMAELRRLLKET